MKSDDIKLENHLKTLQSRAMYNSKTTQNELVKCCGKEISNEIIKNVKEGGVLHNIILGGTTDMAQQAQLSMSMRYLHGSEVESTAKLFEHLR